MTLYGGADRTQSEWGALLERGGFKLTQLMPLAQPYSLIEGRQLSSS